MGTLGVIFGALIAFVSKKELLYDAIWRKLFIQKTKKFVITTAAFAILYLEIIVSTIVSLFCSDIVDSFTEMQYEETVQYADEITDPIAIASKELPEDERFCYGLLTRESSYHPTTIDPTDKDKALLAKIGEKERRDINSRLNGIIRFINGVAFSVQIVGFWFIAIVIFGNWKLLLITLVADTVWYLIVFGPQKKDQITAKWQHNRAVNEAQDEWESENKEASFMEKQRAISNESKNSSDNTASKGGLSKIIESQREGALEERRKRLSNMESMIQHQSHLGYIDINRDNKHTATYKEVFNAIKELEDAEREGIYKISPLIKSDIKMIKYFKDLPPAKLGKEEDKPVVTKQDIQPSKEVAPLKSSPEKPERPVHNECKDDTINVDLKNLSVLELIALRNEKSNDKALVSKINEEIGSRAKA